MLATGVAAILFAVDLEMQAAGVMQTQESMMVGSLLVVFYCMYGHVEVILQMALE